MNKKAITPELCLTAIASSVFIVIFAVTSIYDKYPLGIIVVILTFPMLLNNVYLMLMSFSFLRVNKHITSLSPLAQCKPDDETSQVCFVHCTKDEPFDVSKMSLLSVLLQDYPGKISVVVVDNSETDSEDYKLWSTYCEAEYRRDIPDIDRGVIFLKRPKGMRGFKGLNFDIAIEYIREHFPATKYVGIIDTDSTLSPSCVRMGINRLSIDPDLSFVQFITKTTNNDVNVFTRVLGLRQTVERLVLGLRSLGGFSLFYGHNALLRIEAVISSGSWNESYRGEPILTEDLNFTMQSAFTGNTGTHLAIDAGEWVPTHIADLCRQWQRWAYGAFQVLFLKPRQILALKSIGGFSERFDMLNQFMFFLSRPFVFIFMFIGINNPSPFTLVVSFVSIAINLMFIATYVHSGDNKTDGNTWFEICLAALSLSFLIDWTISLTFLKFIGRIGASWSPTIKKKHGPRNVNTGTWLYLAFCVMYIFIFLIFNKNGLMGVLFNLLNLFIAGFQFFSIAFFAWHEKTPSTNPAQLNIDNQEV